MTYLGSVGWLGAALFFAQVLAIALLLLCLSGHFPFEQQQPKMKAATGRMLLASSVLATALGVAQIVGFAGRHLAVPIAVIAGGLALLSAPLVMQRLPDSFVDGRRGLAVLAAAVLLLALAMKQLAS